MFGGVGRRGAMKFVDAPAGKGVRKFDGLPTFVEIRHEPRLVGFFLFPVSRRRATARRCRASTAIAYFTGVRTGAPLFLISNTTNFAGFVRLAFRPTVCTSSGPSWNVSPAWSVTSLPLFRPITILPSST